MFIVIDTTVFTLLLGRGYKLSTRSYEMVLVTYGFFEIAINQNEKEVSHLLYRQTIIILFIYCNKKDTSTF